MGMASKEEMTEFEKLCAEYPELRQARENFELTLESKAFENAVEPPSFLKERIFQAINLEAPAKVVPFDTKQVPVRNITRTRWVVAASIILILGCGAILYTLYQKNERLKNEMAKRKNNIEKLDNKSKRLENELIDDNMKKQQVKFETPGNAIPPSINVYWDSTSTDAYLVVKDLTPLPTGQKYHLWAIIKNEHKSLGLFDAPTDDKLILKMNNVQKADSFTITIEKL